MIPMKFVKGNVHIPTKFSIYSKGNIFFTISDYFSFIRKEFYYTNIALLVIFFFSISYPQESINLYHGTILIGITRNDTIWIGVDSKSVGNNGDVIKVCKIIKTPEFVFAYCGLSQSNVKSDNKVTKKINIDKLLYDAYHQGITMDKTMEIFNKIYIQMHEIVGSVMNSEANYPINSVLNEIASTIFFARYDINKIEFIFNYYFPIVGENNHIDVKFSPHRWVSEIGDRVKIAPFFPNVGKRETFVIDTSKDIPTNLRNFIKHRINVDKKNLGPPLILFKLAKTVLIGLKNINHVNNINLKFTLNLD